MTPDQHDTANALRDLLQRHPANDGLRHLPVLIDTEGDAAKLATLQGEAIDLLCRRLSRNGAKPEGLSSADSGFPPAPGPLRAEAFQGPAGELSRRWIRIRRQTQPRR